MVSSVANTSQSEAHAKGDGHCQRSRHGETRDVNLDATQVGRRAESMRSVAFWWFGQPGHRNDGSSASWEPRRGETGKQDRCCRKISLSPGGFGRTGRPETPKVDGFDGKGSGPVTAGS